MSEANTTLTSPGPYRFAKQWGDPVEEKDLEYRVLSAGGECVAVCYGTDDGDCAGPKSAEANGRLLATAWEMRAALEAFVNMRQRAPELRLDETHEVTDLIRAALAAAEGATT